MRVNVLQQTSNEGPGMIADWAQARGHQLFVYHPDQFGHLPTAAETDMLVILGGPMSPNDDLPWIAQERVLIRQLLDRHVPLFGACFGAQQIAKVLGGAVTKAPAKEVGWAPVYRQTTTIPGIPPELSVLHWHEEMCTIPTGGERLFSSDRVPNQGFVWGHHVIGLQFHFEPKPVNVREMVVNDYPYIAGSALGQTAQEIMTRPVPPENAAALFTLLDYVTAPDD